MREERNASLKDVIAITMADIDIFLLKEKDLKKDYFTKEEIRGQLKKTMVKIINSLSKLNYDVNSELKL